jgi:hypothetical protein
VAIAISVGLALVCALAARSSLHSPAVTAAMVGKLVDSPAQRAVAAERSHVSRVAARIADKVER